MTGAGGGRGLHRVDPQLGGDVLQDLDFLRGRRHLDGGFWISGDGGQTVKGKFKVCKFKIIFTGN